MLKNAAEMGVVSRAAKAEADSIARAHKENAELSETDARKAQERLDRAHQLFEAQALAAAREHQLRIAVAGTELSLTRLADQGFQAQRLSRRSSFEQHLAGLVSARMQEWALVCEHAVMEFRILSRLGGDSLLHRNPLMSLMEISWQQGELAEPFEIETFLSLVPTQRDVDPLEIQSTRPKLENALRRFAAYKAAEVKFNLVKWENQTIPAGSDAATYISWDAAVDSDGTILEFSASLLKWISVQWPKIAEELGEHIEMAAIEGDTSITAYIWKADASWYLNWDWPPDASISDSELQNWNTQNVPCKAWGSERFCDPSLASTELVRHGYRVSTPLIPIQNTIESTPIEIYLASKGGRAYELTIQWD